MGYTRVPYTEEHLQDVRFLENNYDTPMAQYPEKWIPIKSQRVIAVADDNMDLACILRASGLGARCLLWNT